MADEEKDRGFAVRDKRHFAAGKTEERKEEKAEGKGGEPGAAAEAEKPGEDQRTEAKGREEAPLPEINFSNFIFSLSTSALIHLGEIPDPVTSKPNKNLPMAKQTIDILGILQEKTKGNLTSDEETLIRNILYDLRMRFVKAKQ
ncbi:MAG: DUF1844 domain-containing protein [Deltaproteobacteria bacterium]|nr:DUF1844 domain-containing protein [Deltaproteobacteria bacterium]